MNKSLSFYNHVWSINLFIESEYRGSKLYFYPWHQEILFVTSDILIYQVSITNTTQRKLFHWDWRKQFVISDILLYQISLYRVTTV